MLGKLCAYRRWHPVGLMLDADTLPAVAPGGHDAGITHRQEPLMATPIPDDLQLVQAGERDGLRVYAVRDCRLPCADLLHATLQPMPTPPQDSERDCDGTTDPSAPAAERAAHGDAHAAPEGLRLLEATASSTGVDHHGTEMTLEALRGMAEQMKAGVVYTPSHRAAEWDDVMGRTVDAEIVQGKVLRGGASGGEEDGYHLRVMVGLYPDHEKSQQLLRAMDRAGAPIGTSIGGWFTDVEFMVNDDDEVERVLIKAVELDHLATTRRPSNRESWIEGLRARAQASLPAMPAPAAVQAGAPAERHVVSVQEGEDTVTVVYGKGADWQGMAPAPAPADDEADDEDTDEVEPAMERAVEAAVADAGDTTVSPPEPVGLDTERCAGEDAAGPDADQRAVPTSTTTQPPEDGHMSEHTEPAVNAPVADERMDRLERSLEQLTGLVSQLATRAAPATEPTISPEQRAAQLEQKVQSLQGSLQRAMATAGRAGMGAITRERIAAAGGFAGMAQRTAGVLGDTSALRMVIEGQAARRDAVGKETPDRAQLEADLRGLLAAAYTDGVISDPAETATWEG
jgi:hypothetical protein